MKIEEKEFRKGYSLKAGENYIELVKHDRIGYDFRRFRIIDTKNKKLINELRYRFYNFAKRKQCIIQSENTERDRLQSQFLTDCGFKIKKSKLNFEKDLTKHEFTYKDLFEYRSLKETGMKKFYEVFRNSAKYPPRTFETFVKATNSIIKGYNSGGTTDLWQTVYLKKKPIGILMPYKIISRFEPKYDIDIPCGTLIYIGLIPEERGMGYGRIIHSRGLMLIKEMGLDRYLGSTESKNQAMISVFRKNNCQHTMTQNFYSVQYS